MERRATATEIVNVIDTFSTHMDLDVTDKLMRISGLMRSKFFTGSAINTEEVARLIDWAIGDTQAKA